MVLIHFVSMGPEETRWERNVPVALVRDSVPRVPWTIEPRPSSPLANIENHAWDGVTDLE